MAKPKKNKKSKSLITETSNISMGAAFEAEAPNVTQENQNIFETPPTNFMPTLPNCFKSLVNRPIELETKEPRRVIELLGENLGISDYKSNIAAFWFLDTLALQVLEYSLNFDGKYRSIFISWLAGEMKFIQEKNPSREEFFNEMNELFCNTAVKLVSGESLLHWDLMFPNQNERNVDDGIKEIIGQRSSKKNSRRQKEPNSSKEVRIVTEIPNEVEEVQEDTQKTDPSEVLNAITEATFEMYGSESRYSLILAAFVEPVEVHTIVLPNLKEPRKIKQPEFDNNMQTIIDKKLSGKQSKDLKDKKEQKEPAKSKKKNKNDVILKPPPPSMIDEEILSKKREYILPLMESPDAQKMLRSKDN